MKNMATVRTSIQLTNGMTPALRQMANSLNMVLSSFEAVQRASSETVDVSAIQAARAELNKAEITFNEIEQEIREADQAQQQFNSDVRNGQGAAAGLFSQFKRVVGVLGMGFGVKQLVGVSDEMVSITARLNLMNDGLQTTAELQDMIYNSAQRARASYVDTAQVVSKLGILAGDAFGSNEEMVAFSELMNKQFKIGGASIQEQTAAMYQLTQAMAAGRLQGDEFRSIMENAPMLAQSIAEHMSMTTGELREMSREGLITADVIKNAMFAAADETNARFAELPMTWGQVWTSMVNKFLVYSQPLLRVINLLANNWSIIEPLVLGVASAILVYVVAAYGAKAATQAWTAVQAAFNAVMALNPIALVVLSIIVLITLIYMAVAALNKFAGTSISATGIIAGTFAVAIAFIGNLFIGVYNLVIDVVASIGNAIAGFAEFLLNVFIDPVGSVVRLFSGMADSVLGILEGIARGIDTVFGSNLTDSVVGWRSSLDAVVKDMVGEAKIKVPRIDTSLMHLNRFNYGEAWESGYNYGQNLFGGLDDLASMNMANNIASIADYTGQMADSLDVSEEDLKYLRDLAEREVIDRTVLRDVRIDVSNTFGDIRETADVDGIISRFEEKLEEALFSESEGVFNNV